jgi:hypothetical protein
VTSKVDGKPVRWIVFQTPAATSWEVHIKPADDHGRATLTLKPAPSKIAATAIDRVGNASAAAMVEP